MLCSFFIFIFLWGSFKTHDCNTSSIFFPHQSSNNTASYKATQPIALQKFTMIRPLPSAAGRPLAPAVPGSSSRLPRFQLPTRSRPGPPPPLPPSPSPLPTPSRKSQQVANPTKPHAPILQNHSQRSPFRARAPSSRARPPGQDHKVFSPPGSCTQERAGWGCFVLVLSPLAQGKDPGHLNPNAGHFPARRCHFYQDRTTGRIK